MRNNNTKNGKRKDKKGRVLRLGETQQSDGRYRYSYTVNGKQKSVYSWKLEKTDRLPAGKRECISLRELEREILEQVNAKVIANKMTVEQLVINWLKMRDVSLKRATREVHARAFTHMKKDSVFCGKKIIDVQITDVKNFFLNLVDAGVSYANILNVKDIVFPAFRGAYEDRVIIFNPCDFKFSELLSQKKKKKVSLTSEQTEEYLNFIKNDKRFRHYWEAVYILFHTGMRISEFCGLTLKDIDFKKKTIIIERQLRVSDSGELYIETPKSDSGNRVLPMTDDVAECFKALAKENMKRKCQPVLEGYSGFFMLATYNNVTRPAHGKDWISHFRCIWHKYTKLNPDTTLPKVTPHICRHTYCSRMAAAGTPPKVLQYLMGHANIATTMDVYTHVNHDDIKAAVDKTVDLA